MMDALFMVVTLGINPSNREFENLDGNELEGSARRFHTLKSLRLERWSDTGVEHLQMIIESCYTYFQRNPYDTWFKKLDRLMAQAQVSYYNSPLKACHLDLIPYDRNHRRLLGIRLKANRDAFIEQVLESIHRVAYPSVIARRDISPERANPNSPLFDPLRAAILKQRSGQIDEAFWFIFLFVHFGKHLRTGWRLTRDVYGCLGNGAPWTWNRVSADPRRFRSWLADNRATLTGDGVARHFGNHRKYESLDAWSRNGTGEAVESYVQWVAPPRTHQQLIQAAQAEVANDPRRLFHLLYVSMNRVTRFGRTAKFDYLTMLGKLNLANIEPGSTYMEGATGPFTGARLLFGGSTNADFQRAELDNWLVELGDQLEVGMQVLEDSLCNWQKSPSRFTAFRG